MSLIPDVPVVVVVAHVVALVFLFSHTFIANRRRLVLLREIRADLQDPR